MYNRFLENQATEICNNLSEKASKGRLLERERLQNHRKQSKRKGVKEKVREGKEEKGKEPWLHS